MAQTPNPLKLRLLGGFELQSVEGADSAPAGRKVRALLACLALSPEVSWPREKLMALLWSDRAEEQARASLRQALTELRRALGEPSPLRTEQDTVCLDSSAIVVDAIEFPRLAKAGKLAEAAALYRGPLLDGHGVRDGAYEDWLRVERTRLHDLAIDTLYRLAASQSGNAAIETGQRLLQMEPAREEAHRLLMRLYAAAGQRAQALRQYQLCRDALQRELQAQPDAETERLYRQIQDEAPIAPALSIVSTPDRATASDGKPSIAVLPLTNMTNDPEQEYFSDGITEDIITELSRWAGLRVLSRHSSFQYRDKAADLRRIGRELGVKYVVEGSVRRIGNRLSVTVQLVEAASGSHIWAERYDRKLGDIFAIQEDVVRTIVGTLVGRVQAAGTALARRKPPSSLDAYDCVLRGKALPWSEPDSESMQWYEKAIELDPTYSLAHALLSLMLETNWEYDDSGSDALLDQAFEHAKRAIELDENESMGYAMLGRIYLQRQSFDLAEAYISRAVDLNPNNPETISEMGDILTYLGRAKEAIEWLDRAKRVDAFFEPAWYWWVRGLALYLAGRYDDAVSAYERSTARTAGVAAYIGACHAQAGRLERAKAIVSAALVERPELTVTWCMLKSAFKNPTDREHVISGLRSAGLPE